ncbi:transcriptional modulator of MazE/toxin, MazF [Planococcus antarcticus DSM 14505]|uniref:Transcriptional modulator of MazE/toxin, MazF n=1 Tax=Planococcus antarcticus DSM 14505 TaxID=1185653 RepID=A0AA87II87_9BACL|nr:type II toxin-antitoxin system PemK/MazF family toxin [Planococcus antarcticus]EIM05326.1 transcriptional modulator of MazE/toxin, MazF [Planococcus antarcticus DSM 14505]
MAYEYKRHYRAKKWLDKSIAINESYEPSKDKYIPRGRIVNVNYGENIGFEKNEERPSVVVSVNSSNQSSGNVLVVPLTKKQNKQKGGRPFRLLKSQYLLLNEKYTGLSYDSIVQCEDLRVVSKARLGDLLDTVNDDDMKEIDKRLKYMLDL